LVFFDGTFEANPERQGPFRERLDAIIDLKYPLVRLAGLVP